jgi:DNA-directed RNA polymerase I, II, and III subunit RPABC2
MNDQDMFEPIDDVEDGDMRVDLDEESKQIVVSGDQPTSGTSSKAVEKSKRVTTRYLTKYERARVLGTFYDFFQSLFFFRSIDISAVWW